MSAKGFERSTNHWLILHVFFYISQWLVWGPRVWIPKGIKWFGASVTASLGKCRANVRFLKEVVGHLTFWAKEVLKDVQLALNPAPESRNVRPRLAEPDAEPTAVGDRVPLAPAHPIALRVPGGVLAHAGSGFPAPPGHGEDVEDEAADELEQDAEWGCNLPLEYHMTGICLKWHASVLWGN